MFKKISSILLGATLPVLLVVEYGYSLPVFARKYGTSCTTCHSPVPIKLNNFGQAFKNLGYRMPGGDETFIKQQDQELGAQAWKQMWPKTVWPGAIPSQIPLAFQIYLDARYDPEKSDGSKKVPGVWFDTPHEVEIMTAGTSGENISWWSNIEFKNDNTLEIIQAWGQFDHILNNSLLNLRVGRIEPRFVPFSRVSQRFFANDFLTSEFSPTVGTESRHNFKSMQSGIELWGVKSMQETGGGIQYAIGLVNGGGPKVSDEANTAKDFYTRIAYKYGGMGVGESLEETKELKQTENWIDDSVRIGLSVYSGKWGTKEWDFYRLGFDVDVWCGPLNCYAILLSGSDDGILNDSSIGTAKSNAFTIGADYIIFPWITGILRYESSQHQEETGKVSKKAVTRIIPAVVIGIRPNITWTTELVSFMKVEDKVTGDDVLRSRLRFIF